MDLLRILLPPQPTRLIDTIEMNKSNPGIRRILADVKELEKHPSYRYSAHPLEENMFEWHFTIRGPEGSDFKGGLYHGRILLPPEYPFKPPNIVFLNQNGRFEVGKKICLSISAHHEESWQPAWGVRTMLEAIISFLPSEGAGAIGALDWSTEERQKLAKASHDWYCPTCECKIKDLVTEPTEAETEAEGSAEVNAAISQLSFGNKKEVAGEGKVEAAGGGEDEGEEETMEKEKAEVQNEREKKEEDDEEAQSPWREAGCVDTDTPGNITETAAEEKEEVAEAEAETTAHPLTPRASRPSSQQTFDSAETSSAPAHAAGGDDIGTPQLATITTSSSSSDDIPTPPSWGETPPSVLAVRRRILASRAEARARGEVYVPSAEHAVVAAANEGACTPTPGSVSVQSPARSSAAATAESSINAASSSPASGQSPHSSGVPPLQLPDETQPPAPAPAVAGAEAAAAAAMPQAVPVGSPSREAVSRVTIASTDVTLHGETEATRAAAVERTRAEATIAAEAVRQRQEHRGRAQAEARQNRERRELEKVAFAKIVVVFTRFTMFAMFLLLTVQLVKILEGSVWKELAPIYHSEYLL